MRLPRGVRRLFRLGDVATDVAADVDEELEYHLARVAQDLVDEGMEPAAARAEAARRFGDVEAYRRALHHIDGTRRRTMKWTDGWETTRGMVSQAVRSLLRTPGFTFAVVTVLALGMGANTVMFGVVDRLLLSPPRHVVDARDVRTLYLTRSLSDGDVRTSRTLSYPDYVDFRSVAAFASVAALAGDDVETLGRGESAQRVRTQGVTASLFPLLGVRPAMGRFFTADEDRPEAQGTAVLSHEFWERAFGSDPDVLGQVLDLESGTYTVIGVAPPGFTATELEAVDLWLPLETRQARVAGSTDWKEHRNWWFIHAVVRLAPGVTDAMAAQQATAAHRQGREDLIAQGRYDDQASVQAASIIAARGPRPSDESRVARWLAAVSAIVLLIACLNVANLLLARGARRSREVAVRVALGVSRARLVAQLLLESLLLAAMGGGAALILAQVAGQVVYRTLLPNVAFVGEVTSLHLVLFLGGTTLAAALAAGVVPAFHAVRNDPAASLKNGGQGSGRAPSRMRSAFLVGQAALSVVLLVAAGLFVKSLGAATGTDLGFDAQEVVVAQFEWNETLPGSEREVIYLQAQERVRSVPGVRAVGLSYTVPFQTSIAVEEPRIPGLDSFPRHPAGGPYFNKVTSGYFEAMGLAVLRGRSFTPDDDLPGAAPVSVVTEGLARALWPAGDAVGSCMYFDDDDAPEPLCTQVVGIVEDHRREELVEADPHWLYFMNQTHPTFPGPPQALMVGTVGQAEGRVAAIQSALRATSPQIRWVAAQPLQANVEPQLRSWTLGASMFTLFGLLALVVAAWGLYSVLAFDVSLRRRELGVRAALGADVSSLVGMVLRRASRLVAVGVALGLATAALASRWLGGLLFQVSPWDATVYAVVAATLMVVAVVAGLIPAWRATRVDPREALTAE